jgi:hypothetical protein
VVVRVHVRSFTKTYSPIPDEVDHTKIVRTQYPDWYFEGWIIQDGHFDPSPDAPAVRCYLETLGPTANGNFQTGYLQFINDPPRL